MALAINLAGIVSESIVDGPGIRTVFFAQGCPHNCAGCHNPKTHTTGTGTNLSVDACVCAVKKNPLVKGVTFSGGEPFAQAGAFCELARLLKQSNYEIAVYTGYTFEQLLNLGIEQKELLSHIDILIDGKFVIEQKNLNLKCKGSENQRIINVKQSLKNNCVILSNDIRWGCEKCE